MGDLTRVDDRSNIESSARSSITSLYTVRVEAGLTLTLVLTGAAAWLQQRSGSYPGRHACMLLLAFAPPQTEEETKKCATHQKAKSTITSNIW